jgi:hypothetical protein
MPLEIRPSNNLKQPLNRRLVVSNANPGMVEIYKRWGSCLTTSLRSRLIAGAIDMLRCRPSFSLCCRQTPPLLIE